MLGLLIAFVGGGFIGLCVGIWAVADNVRRSPTGCIVCRRPWTPTHDQGAHVHPITPEAGDPE